MAESARRPWRRELRNSLGTVKYFLTTEAASPVRFRAPRMLAQGFYSDRRWLLPAGASRRTGYIADLPYNRLAARMNPAGVQRLLNDKVGFAEALQERHLAHRAPRTFGVVLDGVWQPAAGGGDGPCVLKPAGGEGGAGVRVFDSVAAATAAAGLGTAILQERVHQHPDQARLWGGSLNTIRVLAVRTADGRVVLPRAVQRIGRRSTGVVDNFSSGGLVAWVDLQHGTLGSVTTRVERPVRYTFERHPDTGEQLTGRAVPCWPEVVRLACDLMAGFPDARHISWDLAVGVDGPVVIEGNARHVGLTSYQLHGAFTTDPGVRDYYRSWGLLPR